jgi:cytochrome bd ubiquinol oxidase subunit I
MDDFMAARWQMAVSLGFHIVFACIGMVMPVLMAFSEWKWIRTGRQVYIDVAKAWSKGAAIFFAVGAVSGTVLSFELGMLFPEFMKHAGPIIGMPFSWEGTAFFIEAIFLGVFLYGWNRLNKWVHWLSGIAVGLSGIMSGIFVVAANSWMNSPTGFTWENGKALNIDPVAAMFNPAWFQQALHMILAAFIATSFAVAGVHAFLLLKNRKNAFHKTACRIALAFGAVAAFLQPLSGDISAKQIAKYQPAKLAAMEALYKTTKSADLIIGGVPDNKTQEVDYAIHLHGLLSFMVHGDFNATVTGLDKFPEEERPPVAIVHYSFQIMIGIAFLLALTGFLYLLFSLKWKQVLGRKWWLTFIACLTPFGFIAVEAGWIVTEVGRQPWIIYGIMKTRDAVTPMPGIRYSFYAVTFIYLLLTVLIIWLLRRQIKAVPMNYPSAVNAND